MNGFAITVGLGAALGLYRVGRQQSGQWLDDALLALTGSLIGARLGYVLVNLPYFSQNPLEIPQVWLGGLQSGGAVVGWLAALALMAWSRKISLARMADWLYPLIPPLVIAIWMGCWLEGVGYGQTLPPGTLWGVPSVDESGALALRVPVQLMAALSLLIFFALLETLTPVPRPAGWFSTLAGTWVVVVGLAASLLRSDPAPLWHNLRLDTWTNLVWLVVFLAIFTRVNFIARRQSKGSSSNLK